MPKLMFAHSFEAESYNAAFTPQSNLIEITYIADGTLTFVTTDCTFKASKGDVICFFHDEAMTVIAERSHCHHTVGFFLDHSPCQSSDGIHLPNIIYAKNGTEKICRLIDEIIGDSTTLKASVTKCAAKLFGLFLNIDTVYKKSASRLVPGEQLYVRKIKEYVNSNLHLPISQKSAAEHLGITPGYLCNIFKKNQGTTFMKYVNRIKLENIKSIMDREKIPLYKAAALYGYSDANYVSRLYSEIFGHSITRKQDKKITEND